MGNIIFWIIGILFILCIFGFIFLVIPSENKQMKDFCLDNGYEDYEKARVGWDENYCIKIRDNVIIKREIQLCNMKGITLFDYCFVEKEDHK